MTDRFSLLVCSHSTRTRPPVIVELMKTRSQATLARTRDSSRLSSSPRTATSFSRGPHCAVLDTVYSASRPLDTRRSRRSRFSATSHSPATTRRTSAPTTSSTLSTKPSRTRPFLNVVRGTSAHGLLGRRASTTLASATDRQRGRCSGTGRIQGSGRTGVEGKAGRVDTFVGASVFASRAESERERLGGDLLKLLLAQLSDARCGD